MTDRYLQAILITVAVSGLTSDCSNYDPAKEDGHIQCKQTRQTLFVKSGDNLILNCTCFDKTNGQWTGQNKRASSTSYQIIPYTQGTELNPRLNKSKYMVFGGYDDYKCYLKIINFLSDDDGTYMCQYISLSTIYIEEYNVVASNLPEPPGNLSAFLNTTTFVVFWQPGIDGGLPQTFYIEYRLESKSEWDIVGPISYSNFTTDQSLNYTINDIVFAKKYYIRMYADNVVGQSNYTNVFCVHMEVADCSNNSKKYNYPVWQIISSLLGGILILSMCGNIHYLLTRKTKSENVSENLQEGHYYEIRPRNENNMDHSSIQGIRNYLQETVTSVSRLSSEGTDSITSSLQKATSSESSVRSLSNLLLNESEYENPYQTIDHENIEMNPYSIITSDRYQNTTIFQKDIQNNNIEHAIQNVTEKDPWLIIYKNVKDIDKNHESIYEVLDTENQEFTDIS